MNCVKEKKDTSAFVVDPMDPRGKNKEEMERRLMKN